MAEQDQEPRHNLMRRSVGIERAAGLVERGLELASAISVNAFVTICTGSHHALALRRDQSLWAWGSNKHGQLGLSDSGEDAKSERPSHVPGDSDWVTMAAGAEHSLALKRSGSLWAWGLGSFGQLGLGDTRGRTGTTRVSDDSDWMLAVAGGDHSLALKRDGSLWAWGRNQAGQLGLGDIQTRQCPSLVSRDVEWTAIAAGYDHTVAVKSDGSLWTWGKNQDGQLGLGDAHPRAVPTRVADGSDWMLAVAGGNHCLALKRDGSLWAWGGNDVGELGVGDRAQRNRPSLVGDDCDWAALATGSRHTVALKRDGSLWCWGWSCWSRSCLGEEGSYAPMRLGDDSDWMAAAAGHVYTLGLKRDGSLWAWGDDGFSQLAVSDTVHPARPVPVAAARVLQPDYPAASPVAPGADKPIAIGNPYQGGIVAYILEPGDPGYAAGETHGLIAAAADQVPYPPGIQWVTEPCWGAHVPGTSTDLGSGSANTDKIIAQNGAGMDYAAGLAREYNGGGYSDWYLPSKDELNKLYLNRVVIGGFDAAPGHYYWSSSEFEANVNLGWIQGFGDGCQLRDEYIDDKNGVRAVRSF